MLTEEGDFITNIKGIGNEIDFKSTNMQLD